jgi:hypothetical protein
MPSLTLPSSHERRYLAADLADRLGHSPDYWMRQARRKTIPHRRMGRDVWWEEEDVQQIVSAALVEPVEPVDPLRSQTARSRTLSERR